MAELWPTSVAAPLAVLVALALDLALGEPPARWHPVVGIGRYLSYMGSRVAPARDAPPQQARAFVGGALAWCLGALLVVVLALVVVGAMASWVWWAQALVLGVLLKPLLA